MKKGRCYQFFALFGPDEPLAGTHMHRIAHIFCDGPHVVAQALSHRRCARLQTAVRVNPVVEIAPQPQAPLQMLFNTRHALSATKQAGLLATHRSVQPLQVRCVDLGTDAQGQRSVGEDLSCGQTTLASARPTDFPSGCGFSSPRRPTSRRAVSNPHASCDHGPCDGGDAEFRRTPPGSHAGKASDRPPRATAHRQANRLQATEVTNSFANSKVRGPGRARRSGRIGSSRPTPHGPRALPMPRRLLSRGAGVPTTFFAGHTRPCNSSNCTAGIGVRCCSICSRWKSSARGPACRSTRCTVRSSTPQISALAVIEQPWLKTFHDALQRFIRHLGVLVQGAASFAEALAAVRAIQTANVFAFADPFNDAEDVTGVESIEGGAIFVGARECA